MSTTGSNLKTERPENIRPEAFFNLIEANRDHIRKTFPVTLEACADLYKTKIFLHEAIDRQLRGEGYAFFIHALESHDLIGYIAVKNISQRIRKCELAYFIDKDSVGKGVISSVLPSIFSFCFHDLGMNKIYVSVSQDNAASQQVARKFGFKEEGLLRDEFQNGQGELEDILYFGLLKSDFDER